MCSDTAFSFGLSISPATDSLLLLHYLPFLRLAPGDALPDCYFLDYYMQDTQAGRCRSATSVLPWQPALVGSLAGKGLARRGMVCC